MQKNDDLLLDEELAAAFLGEELETPAESPLETPATPADLPETGEEWESDEEDFPGQLAIDMYETNEKLIIKARTAGVDKKDLDVSISDNLLTISGTLSSGSDAEIIKFHFQECYWGDFTRTVVLPVPVHEDKVEAVLKEGVLTISFAKIEQKKTTLVAIM